MLFFVTLSWGLTFPLIKSAVSYITPTSFVVIRFFLATVFLFPFVVNILKKISKMILFTGLLLGILNSITYETQTIGMQTISAAQSAFIVGTNIVLVPLLAPIFRLHGTCKIDFFAAIVCLIGLFIFTHFAMHFNIGSFWCFISALSIALSIVVLQRITTIKYFSSFKLLAFYQILFTIPLPIFLSIHNDYLYNLTKISVIISLLFCAIFATSISLLLQTKYQCRVNTTKAALISSFEPIFASLFAIIMHQEHLSLNMIIGGTIMFFGISLHSIYNLYKNS